MREAFDYLRGTDKSISPELKAAVLSAFELFCNDLKIPGISGVSGKLTFLDTYTNSLRSHLMTRVNIDLSCATTVRASQLFKSVTTSTEPHFVPEEISLREFSKSFRSMSLYSNLMSRLSNFCDTYGIKFSDQDEVSFTYQAEPDEPIATEASYVFREINGCTISINGQIKASI